ncbi:MAG: hypothetical protein AB7O28_03440 [Vicinamibacterales bacterium]
MTPCLRPDELVDLADGTLAPERRAHAERCPACAARAAEIAAALDLAGDDIVPEPPAGFWASVNAGVAARLDEATGASSWRGRRWTILVPAAAAAAVLLALGLGTKAPASSPQEAAPEPPASVTSSAPPADDGDDALALIGDLTIGLPDAGWAPLNVVRLPDLGTAAALLSSDEQDALAALLRAAVDRPES